MKMMSKEELIKKYFHAGYKYTEMVDFLNAQGVKIKYRQLQRELKKIRLRRKNIIEDEEAICRIIAHEVCGSGRCMGYKSMWRKIKQLYEENAYRDTVLKIMHIADPEGIASRSKRVLKRRQYVTPGPNWVWHLDGYDKLKPFGISIHGCTDGHSRFLIWLQALISNKKPEVIAYYYLNSIKSLGFMPRIIRCDHGTEHSIIEPLHIALRTDHDDEHSGYNSFKKGKSTANQRIESFWVRMRRYTINFYIEKFKEMKDKNILDDSDDIHIGFIRYCFGNLIQAELDLVVEQWNRHPIRKQKGQNVVSGKPAHIYNFPQNYDAQDYRKEINKEHVDICFSKYAEKPVLFEPVYSELAKLLAPDHEIPRSFEEGLRLFIQLTDAIKEFDKKSAKTA